MLLDLGRAVSFLLSVLSLYALIDTAFFLTATTWEQRLMASITLSQALARTLALR